MPAVRNEFRPSQFWFYCKYSRRARKYETELLGKFEYAYVSIDKNK